MSHPDEYGVRKPAQVEKFPERFPAVVGGRRVVDMDQLASDVQPKSAEAATLPGEPDFTNDPDQRAKLMLDQIADDLLWIPYGAMMDFAREVLGNDGAAPKTPNEMADVLHRWAKNRAAGKR